MYNTIKKVEMVNNSNQPQQKKEKIDFLMNEMKTFEITDTDMENIFNSDYLKECLERLEFDEYHIKQSIKSIRDRIKEIGYIKQIEEEIQNNLSEIDDLYRFIDKVCDNDEDKEEPLSKIEELLEQNEELNEEITEFYENLNKN